MTEKTALVTGGASGLGKAIAKRLASEGATVVITDVQRGLGERTAAELQVTFLAHDVTEESQWTDVMRQVEVRFGRLDIHINNAGILGAMDDVSPETTRLDDWKQLFRVNVESVFLGCRAAIAAMRRSGGGSIVNISSVAGVLATPYATAYGASKAAVRHITKSVAQHCVEEGLNIRCNSVHPGIVCTPLWYGQAEAQSAKRGVSIDRITEEAKLKVPMGELTRPDDVAAAVAFLASDDARHITGTKVIVDGGIINCDTFHIRRAAQYSDASLSKIGRP